MEQLEKIKTEVTQQIEVLRSKSVELVLAIQKIQVTDAVTLDLSERKVKEGNDFINNVKEQKSVIKAPILDLTDKIEELFKSLIDPVKTALDKAKDDQLKYQQAQKVIADRKKAEDEKAIADKAAALVEANEKLHRIHLQLYARLYGGEWHTKDGEIKTSLGCLSPLEITNLRTFILQKYPSPDEFPDAMKEKLIKMKEDYMTCIDHKWRWLLAEEDKHPTDLKYVIEQDMNRLNMLYNLDYEQTEKKIKQETIKALKETEKASTTVLKGIRNTIAYEVTDFSQVPDQYKEVNDKKVKEFIKSFREEIFAEENPKVIPGIKFLKEQKKTVTH